MSDWSLTCKVANTIATHLAESYRATEVSVSYEYNLKRCFIKVSHNRYLTTNADATISIYQDEVHIHLTSSKCVLLMADPKLFEKIYQIIRAWKESHYQSNLRYQQMDVGGLPLRKVL